MVDGGNKDNGGDAGNGSADAVWQRDYPMSRLSSWRAGGRASWLFTPLRLAREGDNPMLTLPLSPPPRVWRTRGSVPPLFVGLGSNLLVRDGGYDGIVVRTAPGLSALSLDDEGCVVAGAGVACPKLARFCVRQGLDAAFFAGIPGSVGGALAMNAGCHGSDTWSHVLSVDVLEGGETRRLSPSAFDIGYRSMRPRKEAADGEAVYFTAARFRFPASTAAEEKIKVLLQRRAETQPLGNASAGSVFCNPPNDHAGRLIEACGLKNTRIGGAVVSDKHANFIVNDGDASAADIEQLILHVQARVMEATGTALKPEVRIVGRAA